MKGRKRVTWFLPPETIRRIKVEAAASDRDQSEVVDAACEEYLDRLREELRREPAAASA